jgi:hypothetical protein
MSMPRAKQKLVWGACERQGKQFWTQIGLAWEAEDGSIAARLNAFPMSGQICIKEGYDEAAEAALVVGEVAR